MTPREILDEFRARGIQLKPIGHRLRAIGPTSALDADIRARFAECRDAILDLVLAEDVPDDTPIPMTNVQQRMHLNSEKSNGVDHVRAVFEFEGALDEDILASAAQALTQLHPVLRMRFKQDDGRTVQVLGPHTRIGIERITTNEGDSIEHALDEFINRPFQVAEEPLFRLGLTDSTPDGRRTLAIVVHHALADGESLGILFDDLASNYETFQSGSFPEPTHSEQATLEQIKRFNEGTTAYTQEHVQEWLAALGADSQGSLPPCDEGVDGAPHPSFERMNTPFTRQDKAEIDALLAKESISRLALLIATIGIIITRTTGKQGYTLGLAVSDRRHQVLEKAIANLATDLPVHVVMPEDATARSALKTAKDAVLSALDRPSIPLEALIAAGTLPPLGRRQLRLPIAVAAYERTNQKFQIGDIELQRNDDTHPNPFIGLGLRLINTSEELSLFVEWDESILTRERAERLSNAFLEITKAMAHDPDIPIKELPLDPALSEGVILEPVEQRSTEAPDVGKTRPASLIESHLASIWSEMLGVFPIQRTDRFFAIGGNSLQIIRMIDKVESTLGAKLSIADFMGDPMLAELAKRVEGRSDNLEIPPAIWLTKDRTKPLAFCLAGIGGLAAFSYRGVADALEGSISLIGVQLPGVGAGGEAVENVLDMASWVRDTILEKHDPEQPLRIVGYSAGGIIALEAAKMLAESGHKVSPVMLIDTLAPVPQFKRGLMGMLQGKMRQARLARRIKKAVGENTMLDLDESGGALERRLGSALDRTRLALIRHQLSDYTGTVHLLCSTGENARAREDAWRNVVSGEVTATNLPYDHLDVLNEGAEAVSEVIKNNLD